MGYCIGPYLMNHPNIGRKRSICGCMVLMFVFSIVSMMAGNGNLVVLFISIAFVKAGDSINSLVLDMIFRLNLCILQNCTKPCLGAKAREYVLWLGKLQWFSWELLDCQRLSG